jgi:hypothetical protein
MLFEYLKTYSEFLKIDRQTSLTSFLKTIFYKILLKTIFYKNSMYKQAYVRPLFVSDALQRNNMMIAHTS